jgi:hypothetical protein
MSSTEARPATPPFGPPPKVERLNVYVKDLVLPPEMVREVEQLWKAGSDRSKAQRAWIEHCIKIDYFFGGQTIGYVNTPRGMLVVLRGDEPSDEFYEVVWKMRLEENQEVIVDCPRRLDDDTGYIG